MTAKESIIDQLGQITFRLETNIDTLQYRIDNNKRVEELWVPIQTDLEKLKQLKTQIEIWV